MMLFVWAYEVAEFNTRRGLRNARGNDGFAWVTSHVFRKTAATVLDEAGLSARRIADQLGHSRPSLTQDVYMGRQSLDRDAAEALESALDIEDPNVSGG
nr:MULTISPECIES: tyrosine-type recombinase/integrase [unclassified Actinopolyspora]